MILIDTNEQAIDEILKGVELLIDKKIKEATFDKTEKGQIIEVNSDDTYTIKINGMEYSKVKSSGASFNVGDIVSVIIPKNNYSLMYIDEIVLEDIQNSLYNKVDKVVGKELSTNDYSDEDEVYVNSLRNTVRVDETASLVEIAMATQITDSLTVSRNIGAENANFETVTSENFLATDSIKIDGTNIFSLIYPIGSIYMSVNSTNPSTLFGGTWTAWGSGRVPVGINTSDEDFSTTEKTGGEKTHTLSIAEMPSHTHGQVVTAAQSGWEGVRTDYTGDSSSAPYPQGVNTHATGGGQAHNNLQPYITCYMWKRTA